MRVNGVPVVRVCETTSITAIHLSPVSRFADRRICSKIQIYFGLLWGSRLLFVYNSKMIFIDCYMHTRSWRRPWFYLLVRLLTFTSSSLISMRPHLNTRTEMNQFYSLLYRRTSDTSLMQPNAHVTKRCDKAMRYLPSSLRCSILIHHFSMQSNLFKSPHIFMSNHLIIIIHQSPSIFTHNRFDLWKFKLILYSFTDVISKWAVAK